MKISSNTQVHRKELTIWTDIQQFCYDRNCNCDGCDFTEMNLSTACKVKQSIIDYIKEYGLPRRVQTKGIIEDD